MSLDLIDIRDDCFTTGDDYEFNMRYGYGPDKSIETPFNLTGCTIKAQLRDEVINNTIAATFTCTSPNPTDGQISCVLTSVQTASLVFRGAFKNYVFDVEIIDIDGKVETIIQVNLVVRKGVTR